MSDVTEFVVCPACGTRIKAGRDHCLRCFELLPDRDALRRLPIWESMGWSTRRQSAVLAGASLLVVMLLVVIVRTGTTELDADAQPVVSVSKTAAPVASTRPAVVPAAPPADEGPAELVHAGSEGDEPFLEMPGGTDGGDTAHHDQLLAHFRRAQTAVESGHWTRAISEYGAAASLSSDDAAAQYNFGLALHRRGDEREAISAFQRAIKLAPDQAMFHLPLAVAFENVGQIGDAAREYRTFVSASPDAPEADRARRRIEAMSTGNRGAAQVP